MKTIFSLAAVKSSVCGVVAGAVLFLSSSSVRAEYTVIGTNFTEGVSPFWTFLDSSAAGAPWNTIFDNTSPLSAGVMTNDKPTTQALLQWDALTLANVGDYIKVYISVRTPAVESSGTLAMTLFNTPTSLPGNSFGYTSYPLASANGYTYAQGYGTTAVSLQRVVNNAATTISSPAVTVSPGDSAAHSIILSATRTSTGVQFAVSVDGTTRSFNDTTPPGYVFNSLRIDGGGMPVEVDNLYVKASFPTTAYSFTLSNPSITSAGVFDSTGKLIRNLWSKVPLACTTYSMEWNNTDDSGVTVPPGTYTIKVLYHNQSYTWDGVIGNTSKSFAGNQVWRSLLAPACMSIAPSGVGYMSIGYNEGQADIKSFSTSDLQTATDAVIADSSVEWWHVATDGTNYYLTDAANGYDSNNNTFVAAYKVSDGTAATFSSGVTTKTSSNRTFASVIDLASEINTPAAVDAAFVTAHKATGLAVQSSGTMLAVSHGGQNQVKIYNRTTGALLQTLSVSAPGEVAFAPSGDLWVLTGTSAVRYTNLATTPSVATTITGFSAPLAVAVDPNSSNTVLVSDGGTSQQVKCFDSTGTSQWTLGQAGGYTNGPDVTTNKFWFLDITYNIPQTYLAFQPDGSFWVGDKANFRTLHYSSARAYLGQIAWIPNRLQMTADPNNPSRVFSAYMEYAVDYTKPLLPGDPDPAFGGNGSWKLVKNWAANLDLSRYGKFETVVTLSNGRTYGQMHDSLASGYSCTVVELPSTGSLRLTGLVMADGSLGQILYANGDLRYPARTGTANPYLQYAYKKALTGFDGSGNPQWGAQVTLASAPVNYGVVGSNTTALDPAISSGWGITPRIPITTSNKVVFYQPGESHSEPNTHLGTVALSGTNFLWKSAPGAIVTTPDGLGTFNDSTSYGGHDGIAVFADDNDIIAAYDGQYGSYSNQWLHYNEDGLFVGQFGVSNSLWGLPDYITGPMAAPGFAGNIGMAMMVNSAGTRYIYCVDESNHSGVHRWHLDGTVHEFSASTTLNTAVTLGSSGLSTTSNVLLNPSFESEASTIALSRALGSTQIPVGWAVNNGSDGSGIGAFYTEWTGNAFARSFPYHATIAKSSAYSVNPYQSMHGLPNGTYTLSAWVINSGGQTSATMYCKKNPNSATVDYSVNLPTASTWTQVTIPGIVLTGAAEIGFNVQGGAGQYIYLDDVSLHK